MAVAEGEIQRLAAPVKVAVIAPPRAPDGALSIHLWARRQAHATQAAGAAVRLLAPRIPIALALRMLRHGEDIDLVHVHSVAAAHALGRARLKMPIVISVYGGDVFAASNEKLDGAQLLSAALGAARLTLAGSEGAAAIARDHGARETRVVHLGTDLPDRLPRTLCKQADPQQPSPTLVTVGDLVARKRHTDVLRALAVLSERHSGLRYLMIGEGPERVALEGLAARLGVAERVEITGTLPPDEAIARARDCTVFVMPSTEEALGIAYVEAMAAGVPAIGCRGEPGPEEIAAAGDGFVLVPPGDIERLSQRIDELLCDQQRLREAGQHARETVAAQFTWERCGRETVSAYEDALR
jgi:teichuronic acid biosynthesis glycosyltransferase TuaC